MSEIYPKHKSHMQYARMLTRECHRSIDHVRALAEQVLFLSTALIHESGYQVVQIFPLTPQENQTINLPEKTNSIRTA